jgi:hypothetical protein
MADAALVDDPTPKDRVLRNLRHIQSILESGDSLDARRYEIDRNVRNCLSWEPELANLLSDDRRA